MTLPPAWAETTLGACQAKASSIDPRTCPTETFDLYSVPSYSAYAPEQVLGANIGSSKQHVRQDDVLLCKIVPHIRRSWTVPPAGANRQIASSEWIVLRDHGLEPEFLRRFLLSDGFHEQFMRTVSGVGGSLMRARPADAGRIKVPVPPIGEQRRIVAKLDTMTHRLARARVDLQKVLSHCRGLRLQVCEAAVMSDAGERPLTEVLLDLRYGTSRKCGYWDGRAVLRIPNIERGEIDLNDLKFAVFDEREIRALSLQLGDILVIRSNGSLDLVGRSAVVDERAVGMLYAGYLIRLRLDHALAAPEYVQLWLMAPSTRQVIEGLARSSSGVNNINAQQLRELPIRLPDLGAQRRAVAEATAAFARADRLEAEAKKALALIDRLEAAILAKAFRGELVPQDPNDEPASVLLERIRARRAAEPKPRRGRQSAVAA